MKRAWILLAIAGLTWGCGDLEEDCDPAADAACVCTDDDGNMCDPEYPDMYPNCSCAIEDDS